MERIPDPYRTLGVLRGATDAQIKAAHRKLAKRFHPDGSTGDTDRFLAIQEAYLLLSDPLRRREWDAANGAGPERAGDPSRARARGSRPASGRPTDPGRTTPGGAGPAAGRSGTGRAPGAAGTGARAGTPGWAGSDRDPAAHSSTWSAAGVPWWEDFAPRDRGAASAGAGSARSGGAASGAGASGGASGRARPSGSGASGASGSGASAGGSGRSAAGGGSAGTRPGTATGAGAAPRPDPAASAERGTTSGSPTGTQRPGGRTPDEMDVYARSSGAAWSMAARRYFRKGEADLPKGGSWTYRGTQVVTGAEARKVAEEAAARKRAADSLLRSRGQGNGGPSGGRTAFSHEGPTAARSAAGVRPATSGPSRPSGSTPPPSAQARPAGPAAASPTSDRPSLLRRMRRALGLD